MTKYSQKAQDKIETVMHEFKHGKLKSGKGGKGGVVKNRKQAIAIGLNEARQEGDKVPKKRV
jgi:ribosomal protein L7/L12